MNTKQTLLSIEENLSSDTFSKNQALDLADNLFLLIQISDLNKDQLDQLQSKFLEKINLHNMSDLMQNQMNYAIKIAESSGELLYEEMHKLFSLCDTIYALENLGLKSDDNLKEAHHKVIKNRLQSEKGKAKMVAEDKQGNRKIDLWWYKEALSY